MMKQENQQQFLNVFAV